ncbi:low molecular weight protein-tyrosine-phosphatase [Virgibacillus byunsanensis]|uniref:protein-tyrosine-phosphatase n=1 Tax=Virgibacillus byunsanensis TaxID=570945 RepID=A0ABW3LRK4_9BACI
MVGVEMIHVLFICLGNICRSPMAEAVFRSLVEKEGLAQQINIDSAGIGNWHAGELPHKGTRDILDQQKITYRDMKARQVHRKDWDNFDYIIAMDEQNIKDLQDLKDKENGIIVARLMDFVDNPEEVNVPDPYFTGDFDYTYKLVSKGCLNLLNSIRETHNI